MAGSQQSNPLNFQNVQEAVKIHYKPMRVKNMVYKKNPFLAMIPKYTRFGGLNMPIPLRFHDPQRRSATFATGQANTSTSGLVQFQISRKRDYSFAYIDGETINATKGDNNAFLRYLTMEIDGAVNSITRSLSVAMYRDGFGTLGQLNATAVASATVTLLNVEEVTNFEVGMSCIFADNFAATTGVVRNSGTPIAITAVDRDTGDLTFASDLTGIVTASDFIAAAGDSSQADVTAGTRLKVSGLDGWVPSVSPTATLFNGVDRTADPTRLGGIRVDGSGQPIEEAIYDASARIAREGGRPDTVFCDFETFATLEKAFAGKLRYNSFKAIDVDIGFTGFEIVGPSGNMRVIPDYNCQPDVIWMLQMDTWQLCTLGEAPQFLDLDGNRMLRDAGADAYEIRIGYYGEMACYAPGWNARLALA